MFAILSLMEFLLRAHICGLQSVQLHVCNGLQRQKAVLLTWQNAISNERKEKEQQKRNEKKEQVLFWRLVFIGKKFHLQRVFLHIYIFGTSLKSYAQSQYVCTFYRIQKKNKHSSSDTIVFAGLFMSLMPYTEWAEVIVVTCRSSCCCLTVCLFVKVRKFALDQALTASHCITQNCIKQVIQLTTSQFCVSLVFDLFLL